MTFGPGTAQGGGLPPVEDADFKPAAPADAGSEDSSDKSPKTAKQTDQSQPQQTDQQSTDGQQPDQQAAKDKGPGPWDAEMAKRGITDPNVSQFFREVVQPYITQLEQGAGGNDVFEGDTEAAEVAKQLIDEFRADPEKAYRELGVELGLVDDDGMEGVDPTGAPPPPEPEGLTPDEQNQDDPRLQYVDEMMERERQQAEDAEYEEFLTNMGERMPGFDADLFTTFVVASGGNLDAAFTQYQKYHRSPDPTPDAPPSPDGGTPPPSAPRHSSIGDTISAWLAEENASNPKR